MMPKAARDTAETLGSRQEPGGLYRANGKGPEFLTVRRLERMVLVRRGTPTRGSHPGRPRCP
jgi:hypothetical protein